MSGFFFARFGKYSVRNQLAESKKSKDAGKVIKFQAGLPVKEWKAELEKLTAERYALCDAYDRLDDELWNVEALRRGAENTMREDIQQTQPTRTRGMEL